MVRDRARPFDQNSHFRDGISGMIIVSVHPEVLARVAILVSAPVVADPGRLDNGRAAAGLACSAGTMLPGFADRNFDRT